MKQLYTIQTQDSPAFPNILWSLPETKVQAGNLLVIGGHSNGMHGLSKAVQAANSVAPIHLKIITPDKLRNLLSGNEFVFAKSTNLGSLDNSSWQEINPMLNWADCVLFPGNLSNNSSTQLLVDRIISSIRCPKILVGDASNRLVSSGAVYILRLEGVQNLSKLLASPVTVTTQMNIDDLTNSLKILSQRLDSIIVMVDTQNTLVSDKDNVILHKNNHFDPETLSGRIGNMLANSKARLFEQVASALISH